MYAHQPLCNQASIDPCIQAAVKGKNTQQSGHMGQKFPRVKLELLVKYYS